MRAHRAWLIVLALALGDPAHATTQVGKKATEAMKKERVICWPGEPEIQNRSMARPRPPIRLPAELANARVRAGSLLVLKLCVTDSGDVARVLMIKSSGDTGVDDFYTKELSKRTFTPVEREKRRVQSVVSVAFAIDVK